MRVVLDRVARVLLRQLKVVALMARFATENPNTLERRNRPPVSRRALHSVLTGALVVSGLLVATPATAEPVPDAPTSDESISAIEEIAPEVLEGVHGDIEILGEVAQATYETEAGESRLIELDAASAEIAVEGATTEVVTLSLVTEASTQVEEVAIVDDGALYAEHVDGVSSTAYIKDGASVQVLSTIAGPGADSRIPFEFSAPTLASVQDIDRSLVLLDDSGEMLGGVAPPWAKDANGVDVPTRYEVDGLSITQVVDHTSGQYTYPIVADPIWGTNLFVYVTHHDGKHVLRPSDWGRHVHRTGLTNGNAVNQQIKGSSLMLTYGFEEFKARSRIPSYIFPAVWQQYKCHAMYGKYNGIGGITWDLEFDRPVVHPDHVSWSPPWVFNHQCNWNWPDGRP